VKIINVAEAEQLLVRSSDYGHVIGPEHEIGVDGPATIYSTTSLHVLRVDAMTLI